jgi:DNA (cytosine-5)-methyltransferase 1
VVNYLSVCSGIEAATVAWHPLGWNPVAFSEIEKFPSRVLAHHYPDVPNVGDMTKFEEWNIGAIDLFVGGTPCQSFSVAGLRKGLDDPRGNLMLTFGAIANRFRPRWLVWENVPGVLSSNGGRDFGSFLGMLGKLGYGFAYRVLDAQYFGVAQRRRRVFVVGYFGDWRRAAAVLFERHSLQGHPAPSRETRKDITSFTPTSIGGYSEGCGTLRANGGDIGGGSETLVAAAVSPTVTAGASFSKTSNSQVEIDAVVAQCLTAGVGQRYDPETETLLPIALAENTIGRQPQNGGNGDGFAEGGPMYTLNATGVHGVAQPIAMRESGQGYWMQDDIAGTLRAEGEDRPSRPSHVIGVPEVDAPMINMQPAAVAQPIAFGVGEKPEVAHCLRSGASKADKHESTTYAVQQMAVRRLTPVECERLQGFPDNYTNIPGASDGPRYKALGNSMAVPVMHWIGKRIQFIQENT